jgi:SNF family Na+-dependent transporter
LDRARILAATTNKSVDRFPKLAYDHGGGSFLVPYTIMLLLTGLPLFFMELALGQYSGAGPTRLFGRMAPAMKGLGFAMLGATFYVAIYYNVIIAWTVFYVFAGFQKELPWASCGHDYNTPYCKDAETTPAPGINPNWTVSAPEDYFNQVVLGYTPRESSWSEFGAPSWRLVLCLAAAWIIVCSALIKGVQSSGKVVYFTAIFPFIVLFILFFRAILLDGAVDGIMFYITPKFDRLDNFKVLLFSCFAQLPFTET